MRLQAMAGTSLSTYSAAELDISASVEKIGCQLDSSTAADADFSEVFLGRILASGVDHPLLLEQLA